jgi:acetyl esterase/lipase
MIHHSVLARGTGGRCIIPDYRLASQNLFPAANIDLLVTYLSLLYPNEESMYAAVSASNIVYTGDSPGGSPVSSLLTLLRYIRDHDSCIQFRGRSVEVPPLADIVTVRPHCDHTMSL